MSVKFEDALDVTPLDDGINWRVVQAFYYDTDVDHLGRIEIPEGFITDFASTPQIFWSILPPTGKYDRAAVVHDYLYRTPGVASRKDADAVLYEAMKYPCQVGFFTRWTIWAAVRVGGRSSYKGNK